MALSNFSIREARARPTRVALTFLSIMIGVGAVVAVLLATSTTRQAQRDVLKTVSGKADLEIVADGAGFSGDLLKQVTETPGVQAAVPSLTRFAVLFYGKDFAGRARTQVLGIDPRIDQTVRDYDLVAGEQPTNLRHMLLDSSFASSLKIQVGDSVKILGRGGLKEFRVVGLVRPAGASAVALSSAAYLVLPAAQSVFSAGDHLDQIQLVVDADSTVAQVKLDLEQRLPEGVTVRAVRTSSNMAREAMFAPQNGLYMAIAFALVIAIFIIYNTFQMAVGERRRQLGILRAIGATRKQITWMILREALAISLVAAIAGCIFGVYGARLLNQTTEQLLQVELPNLPLQPLPFVVAIAVGLSVSILGALLPAWRASSVQPIEAMRAVELSHNEAIAWQAKRLGVWVLPLGTILLFVSSTGVTPLGIDVTAIVIMLLGCVLLIPLVLQPACVLLSRVLAPWMGIEAQLAQKQLMRHVGRTSMTVGVLFIAISTSTGMAGNILDNVRDVKQWYSRAIIGDFFVRASLPDLASGTAADLPTETEDEIRRLPGIATLDPMRFVNVQSGEDSVLLVVRDFVGQSTDFFDIQQGDSQEALKGLANRKAVVGSVLALRRNLKLGDSLPIETESGTVSIEVVAIANDYVGGGLTVYLDREYAKQLLGVDGIDALVVKSKEGQLQSLEVELQKYCSEHGLILQSYADLVRLIDGMINGVIASLWMLLSLGCAIAAMGLVNTLTMNILEQTREIGMLRVVAMTRSQVRRMIITQAILLGVLGLVPGVLAGVFVEYAISWSAFAVLGHDIVFNFRPWLFLGSLAVGMLIVLIASWIPAAHAARLKLASALHYE